MKLYTVDEIVKITKIERDKFTYYAKIGMFFAPDKKRKTTVKGGTKAYYAENIIGDIKIIFEYKKKDHSLAQIKAILRTKYEEELSEYFGRVGFHDPSMLAVDSWRAQGYYTGLVRIIYDLCLNVQLAIFERHELWTRMNAELTVVVNEHKCKKREKEILIEEFESTMQNFRDRIENRIIATSKLTNEILNPTRDFLDKFNP